MSEFQIGYDTSIRRSTDNGETWTNISFAKAAPVPAPETDFIEVTNLDSPDHHREYMPGLITPGEVEIDALYTDEEYGRQLADQQSRQEVVYETTFNDGTRFYFRAYPSVSIDTVDVSAERTMKIKLKITGAVRQTLAELKTDMGVAA